MHGVWYTLQTCFFLKSLQKFMKKAIKFLQFLQLQKLSFFKSEHIWYQQIWGVSFLWFYFKEKLGVQNRMWEGGIWDTASTTTGTAGVGHDWKRADG